MKLFLVFLLIYLGNVYNSQIHMYYTTVVTFGDSSSDTGNAYRISNHTWPPVPPFNSNGGYADSLLWSQIFTQQLLTNAVLQDFSYGDATTDSQLVQGTMSYNPNLVANYSIRNNTKPPGVRQQIDQYINSTINTTINFDLTLYVIWVGINNYYFNQTVTPLQTVQSIINCSNALILFGARNLVVINEPPYDRYPQFRNKSTTNTTKYLYIQHNGILTAKINETYYALNTRLNIQLFDSYTLISKILDNYTTYGFENLDNCWDTISNSTVVIKCTNITKRIFTDEYHLTSAMQLLIAKEFYSAFRTSNSSSTRTTLISIKLALCCCLYYFLFKMK
jgi:phospholipase/lecithinase/hemolysin